MKETDNNFIKLLNAYLANPNLPEEEITTFFACLQQTENLSILNNEILKSLERQANEHNFNDEHKEQALKRLFAQLDIPLPDDQFVIRKKRISNWWWAAASFLLLISLSCLLFLNGRDSRKMTTTVLINKDMVMQKIVPGKNGAVLTLANGKQIILDSLHNGIISMQGNTQVLLKNDKLNYKNDNNESSQITYNTISTARGRQYAIVLSDGTKVWLNAGSTIRFPTAFAGNKREVEITGEAYFEVIHNKLMPFKVKVRNQVVEDLGTHFNIKAYDDEAFVKTTLIEGSVSVSEGTKQVLLHPGEQANVATNGKINITKVNTEEVIAWKNGFFAFDNANMQTIMRQLARWYDVDIEYRGEVNNQRFSGKIDKSLPLNDLLNGLHFSKAHFKVDNDERKIIVLP